jgi:RNA polymerase sigma-70 factor (ECF subfamily)
MDATDGLEPEQWLRRHGDYLYRYAYAALRDERRAEDAVQDCLLSALRAREAYAGRAGERTWLTAILKHKIVDIIRAESREQATADLDELAEPYGEFEACFDATGHWSVPVADWGDPERSLEKTQFWRILRHCLDNMPNRLAQLFTLREIVGRDSEAICQEMAISPTNLWTLLYRGRMSLRRCLEQNWPESEAA